MRNRIAVTTKGEAFLAEIQENQTSASNSRAASPVTFPSPLRQYSQYPILSSPQERSISSSIQRSRDRTLADLITHQQNPKRIMGRSYQSSPLSTSRNDTFRNITNKRVGCLSSTEKLNILAQTEREHSKIEEKHRQSQIQYEELLNKVHQVHARQKEASVKQGFDNKKKDGFWINWSQIQVTMESELQNQKLAQQRKTQRLSEYARGKFYTTSTALPRCAFLSNDERKEQDEQKLLKYQQYQLSSSQPSSPLSCKQSTSSQQTKYKQGPKLFIYDKSIFKHTSVRERRYSLLKEFKTDSSVFAAIK